VEERPGAIPELRQEPGGGLRELPQGADQALGDDPWEEFEGAGPGGEELLRVSGQEEGLVQLGEPGPRVEVGAVPGEGLQGGGGWGWLAYAWVRR
jgi:hypothetical protein